MSGYSLKVAAFGFSSYHCFFLSEVSFLCCCASSLSLPLPLLPQRREDCQFSSSYHSLLPCGSFILYFCTQHTHDTHTRSPRVGSLGRKAGRRATSREERFAGLRGASQGLRCTQVWNKKEPSVSSALVSPSCAKKVCFHVLRVLIGMDAASFSSSSSFTSDDAASSPQPPKDRQAKVLLCLL